MNDDKLMLIFNREIERINTESVEKPLGYESLRRLEILTRALKQYQKREVEKENPLGELSSEQLLELIKVGIDDDGRKRKERKAKPKPRPEGPQASSSEAGEC